MVLHFPGQSPSKVLFLYWDFSYKSFSRWITFSKKIESDPIILKIKSLYHLTPSSWTSRVVRPEWVQSWQNANSLTLWHVCVWVYAWVFVYLVHVYVCTYVCAWIYMCVYICLYVCSHVYMHVLCMCIIVFVWMHEFISMCWFCENWLLG